MNKKLLIAAVSLIAIALVVAISDQFINGRDARLGEPIVKMANLIGMDSVRFSQKDKELLLVKDKDSTWRLGSDSGFPADASKISRLVDELTRNEVEMLVSLAKEPAAEFGLTEPNEVTLRKATADVMRIKLGGQRDRGGQYISFANDPKVYLISQSLDGRPEESAWELKRLLNIPANQIKKISFNPARALNKRGVILSREKAEDPIKIEKSAQNANEASNIRSHESILSSLDFKEKTEAGNEEAKKALTKASRILVTLFDGREFDIQVGSTSATPKKYFMLIKAKKGENTASSDTQEVEWINTIMGQYAFEVSTSMAERFEKGLSDMTDKKGS